MDSGREICIDPKRLVRARRSMSQLGQKRHFERASGTSALPSKPRHIVAPQLLVDEISSSLGYFLLKKIRA
jgi:hypothetical protein